MLCVAGGAWGQPGSGEWCRLAYWELGRRVGRQFAVDTATVHVFSEPALHGPSVDCGLCLAAFASGTACEQVLRTRAKIKLGLVLSRELDGVWAYNLSKSPVFVSSPWLRAGDPVRVGPGGCARVWRPYEPPPRPPPRAGPGPHDPRTVRISFAKGWGRGYSRPDIIACPCWLEVLLAPCR